MSYIVWLFYIKPFEPDRAEGETGTEGGGAAGGAGGAVAAAVAEGGARGGAGVGRGAGAARAAGGGAGNGGVSRWHRFRFLDEVGLDFAITGE